MHKPRIVLVPMALVLTMALLITLVGCGGGGTSNTATPTKTAAGATTTATKTPAATKTPTVTKTPTSTSTSGNTLSDIMGGGKNLGDVQFDMVSTSPQLPQATTTKVYYKNYGVADQMKARMEMSQEGATTIYLIDESAQTAYMWMKEENIAYKMDMSQTPSTGEPTENDDQIHPTHVGTETIDGHPCDIWQWTDQGTTEKMWIWTAKSFPVKMEITMSSGTSTMEYKNINFGNIPDSTFQLPASVTVTTFPSYSP